MYSHIVHIERKALTGWAIRPAAGAARFEAYNSTRNIEEVIGGIHGVADGSDEYRLETWYCRNEAEAELMARYLAAQRPGFNVYVCEVKGVASSTTPKVGFAKMSEKGLVPA